MSQRTWQHLQNLLRSRQFAPFLLLRGNGTSQTRNMIKANPSWIYGVSDHGATVFHGAAYLNLSKHIGLFARRPDARELASVPDYFGYSPLDIAASRGNLAATRALLKCTNPSKEEKRTAYYIAMIRGHYVTAGCIGYKEKNHKL